MRYYAHVMTVGIWLAVTVLSGCNATLKPIEASAKECATEAAQAAALKLIECGTRKLTESTP